MRALLSLLVVLTFIGCVPPVTPMEKLTNAAYELNTATRFGRMDVAMGLVKADLQVDFARRHAKWGSDIRIVDVELKGLRPLTSDSAEASLAISWHRLDETTMKVSAVAQKWAQERHGWRMVEERRVAGSPGLFVKIKKKADAKKQATSDVKPSS